MDNIRKIVRGVVNELFDKLEPPIEFNIHNLGKEIQYSLTIDNENTYVVSFFKTTVKVNQNILDLGNDPLPLTSVNFWIATDNPNDPETFKKNTNKGNFLKLMSSIWWVIDDYMKNHPNENFIITPSDKQRRLAFGTIINKHFVSDYNVYGPLMFNNTYDQPQFLLLKK